MRRFAILLLIVALSLPAWGAAAQSEKVLVVGLSEDYNGLDPHRAYEPGGSMIHTAVYDTLVTFPPDSVSEVIPNLAASWDISEDGLVYIFTLRDDVVFSNGDPLTASDVVFSFNRMKNLKDNPAFLADGIVSVDALDDLTVVLTLAAPDPAILAKLIFDAFSVVNAKVVMEQGGADAEDAAETDTAELWFNDNSAGTGPYVVESYEPAVQTVLARNANYWGEATYFDRIVIQNMPEAATQKLALEAGDIHIAMDITADQLPAFEANEAIEVFSTQSDTLIFLLMNQDPETGGVMSNPTVQKAVRYAIDYEGLRILSGVGTKIPPAMVPLGFAGALDESEGIARDVEMAKQLLAEAGYPDGFEINLQYPDFTYIGTEFGVVAQKVQADLAEVGIKVSLTPEELQTSLDLYRGGKHGFGLWLWNPDYQDTLDYVEFLPAGVVGARANWTDANADAKILELRDKVKVETDPEVRKELFHEIQLYEQESGPFVPLFQPGVHFAYRTELQGFHYNGQWRVDLTLLSLAE
ncbi:MAG: ABC transporter substrate-binding protein [Anaerolineae bacterium]|nr:ABC transporter substrate-binding protein [Anaerolineae bacterium]